MTDHDEDLPHLSRKEASEYWAKRYVDIAAVNKMILPDLLRFARTCTMESNIAYGEQQGQGQVRADIPMGKFDLFYFLMDYGGAKGINVKIDALTISGVMEHEVPRDILENYAAQD